MEYNVFQNNKILKKLKDDKGWKLYNLLDVFKDDTKNALKIKKEDYLLQGKYPIVDQGQMYIGGYADIDENLYEDTPSIIFGDHTRIIKYIDFPIFIGADGVKLLKPIIDSSELNVKYTYFFLKSIELPSDGYSRHFKYLKQLIIPVPSIEIQNNIVSVLDKAQELIDKRKEQIQTLDELVKSKFIEMFGDPLKNPKNIPQVTLKELSTLITKGASPNWQGIEYVDDDTQTLFVTSENVREGYIDLTKKKYLMDEFNEKQKRSVLQQGDFLINIVGASIGRAAQFNLDVKANINQAVALVRVKDGVINDKYLLTYLNSPKALQMYESMQVSVARANLSLQNINDLEILLPQIELQNQFADFAKQVDKLKFEMENSLKKLENNFNSIMQRAFNGELFK
ncbi:restriction endonuclease subunit S [Clostridium tertium]|uniref:restriction endonuclease subunit S n=1 Tax=Clostridium tertium TaxID=1559 RepID=UPI0024B39C91|nr:restriction endonuclease subunit S [Clostridium tertium]MDI9218469.1 restriction endonuclease subunit S [Clostridium tertium]